ncbi:MAG TPA: SDR family oxidoreductase, partial [Pelagibacteraceae bacterium]|nr:SDR family oxidoreductase [Pelagibacteraceae bacterium]
MRLSFKGKSAIVTGACGGMGFETTKKLLKNNIKTLMLDIKTPPKNFLENDSKAFFKKIDITNFKKLKKIIDNFYKKNKSVDYLINTTGVLWFNKDISSVKIDFSVWDKVYEINLKTMVYLSKIVIPKMVKNNFGSMVHISSVDALSGDDKPQDAYGSSKAAMIRLSKSLAI